MLCAKLRPDNSFILGWCCSQSCPTFWWGKRGDHKLLFPCAYIYVLACVHVYAPMCVASRVFWCLFVCVSDCNHSACGDREMRLCVSKHCGWIKGIWHSSIQSDSDVNMRQWLTDIKKSHSHTPAQLCACTHTHKQCERDIFWSQWGEEFYLSSHNFGASKAIETKTPGVCSWEAT